MKTILIFFAILFTIGIFKHAGIDLALPFVLFIVLYSIYQLIWKPIAMTISMKKLDRIESRQKKQQAQDHQNSTLK